MIGSAGFSGIFWPRQGAALQALLGIGGGILIGDLGDRQALDRDPETRLVHHHEHGVQAPIRLADEPALGAIIIHHASGIGMNAHFVLDRAAGHFVGSAERTIRFDQDLGHDKQRDALDASGRALDPGEHEMNDVFGKIMLARRDEDFFAENRIGIRRHWARPWF